jgi:hypothetical protein
MIHTLVEKLSVKLAVSVSLTIVLMASLAKNTTTIAVICKQHVPTWMIQTPLVKLWVKNALLLQNVLLVLSAKTNKTIPVPGR